MNSYIFSVGLPLSNDESYLVMKVIIVKEVISCSCDVLPVEIFEESVKCLVASLKVTLSDPLSPKPPHQCRPIHADQICSQI